MDNIVAGIDIGLHGSCCIYLNGKYYAYKPMEYVQLFKRFDGIPISVYIEQIHAFPGMASKTLWLMAEEYGRVLGIMETLDIPITFVTAQKWQRDLDLPKKQDYTQRKENLFLKAKELFPNEPVFKYNADSYLICRYGIKDMDNEAEKTRS